MILARWNRRLGLSFDDVNEFGGLSLLARGGGGSLSRLLLRHIYHLLVHPLDGNVLGTTTG